MSDGPVIDIAHLPAELRGQEKPPTAGQSASSMALHDVQKEHIRKVVDMVGGNKLRAAEILGISRSTLYAFLSAEENVGPKLMRGN